MTPGVRWAYPPGIPADRGTVVTVGTFDGVHLGHWSVLREIRERAAASGRRAVLVTFDPHPLTIVRPEHAPRLLTSPREKKAILAESGLDFVVFISFTEALSRYEPQRFVEEILVGRLGVEELVVGYDHGFGKGRSGDADTMRKIGAKLGLSVDVVAPVSVGLSPVSSSRIRDALREGRLDEANQCLGRPYGLGGLVVRGEGRGRQIGFPTANLRVEDQKLVPAPGIYAVRVSLRSGTFAGALHLGPRPTFPGSPPTIEVHILDFAGDLYGHEIRMEFLHRLRGIEPFESVEKLVEQIGEDVERVRSLVDVG